MQALLSSFELLGRTHPSIYPMSSLPLFVWMLCQRHLMQSQLRTSGRESDSPRRERVGQRGSPRKCYVYRVQHALHLSGKCPRFHWIFRSVRRTVRRQFDVRGRGNCLHGFPGGGRKYGLSVQVLILSVSFSPSVSRNIVIALGAVGRWISAGTDTAGLVHRL